MGLALRYLINLILYATMVVGSAPNAIVTTLTSSVLTNVYAGSRPLITDIDQQ
ncbi:MAG: hypothetical protein KME45_17885 [Stenomitos rutilans HA7619-LM2]|jgi:hypothetical protein|nr:hypothetical protein [Stenomitos rutilans HA7619-LM2]